MLVGGRTNQGRGAAVSHTGALVADHRIWDALSASAGVSIVGTLEELLAAIAYLQRWADTDISGDPDTLVLGVGGGASVLGTDAADRAGLVTTAVSDHGQQAVRDLGYGVGTSIRNPIEIGFGPVSDPDVLVKALDPILEIQPYPDVVIHTNVQAFYSYAGDGIERLFPIIETTAARRLAPHPAVSRAPQSRLRPTRDGRPNPANLPRRRSPRFHPLRRGHGRRRRGQVPRPQPRPHPVASIASCLRRMSLPVGWRW